MTDADLDVAEHLLQRVVDRHLPHLRTRLDRLQPLEAIAILGHLTDATLKRFPPTERTQMARAWADVLLEGVRDSLD
jgi:hypothetical protein